MSMRLWPLVAVATLAMFGGSWTATAMPPEREIQADAPVAHRLADDRATSAPQPPPQESRPLGAPQGWPDRAERSTPLDPSSPQLLRVIAALVVVIGLLVALRALIRRASPLAGGRPSGVLQVLARYPVARGQQLVLLKLDRRIVLAHQSRTAMNLLSEITDPDEVAGLLARVEAAAPARQRFQGLLDRFAASAVDRPGRAGLPGTEAQGEVIDLTRSSSSPPALWRRSS